MTDVLKILLLLLLTACASRPALYAGVAISHEPQAWQDEILKQSGSKWKGQNPYLEGWIGFEWRHGIRCPEFRTGTSISTGAPLNRSTPEELYWSKVMCGIEWGGKK